MDERYDPVGARAPGATARVEAEMARRAQVEDNWQHRSAQMRCRTCMWWALKGIGAVGRCRRRAPTMSGYPVIYESDWCGDHKLDEAKA